jgi:hypothetical protein
MAMLKQFRREKNVCVPLLAVFHCLVPMLLGAVHHQACHHCMHIDHARALQVYSGHISIIYELGHWNGTVLNVALGMIITRST